MEEDGVTLRLTHPLLRITTLKENFHANISLNFTASYVSVVDKFEYFNTAALYYCKFLVLLLTALYIACRE
jgi:hypothetical protein